MMRVRQDVAYFWVDKDSNGYGLIKSAWNGPKKSHDRRGRKTKLLLSMGVSPSWLEIAADAAWGAISNRVYWRDKLLSNPYIWDEWKFIPSAWVSLRERRDREKGTNESSSPSSSSSINPAGVIFHMGSGTRTLWLSPLKLTSTSAWTL